MWFFSKYVLRWAKKVRFNYFVKLTHRSPFSIRSIALIDTVLGRVSQNNFSIFLYSILVWGSRLDIWKEKSNISTNFFCVISFIWFFNTLVAFTFVDLMVNPTTNKKTWTLTQMPRLADKSTEGWTEGQTYLQYWQMLTIIYIHDHLCFIS